MIEARIFCYGISYVWEGNLAVDKVEWKYESTGNDNPQNLNENQKSPMTKKIQQFPIISHEVANKTSQLVISNFLQNTKGKYSSIFKEILSHKFNNLQNLILTNLKLVSVEYLSFINADNMKYICLSHNNLTQTSIKSIAKGKFPELKRLKFDENLIWSMQGLDRMQTKKIWKFEIEYFYKHHCQVNDLRFLMKLSCENSVDFEQLCTEIKYVDIRSRGRIRNDPVEEVLRRKHPRLDIWACDQE